MFFNNNTIQKKELIILLKNNLIIKEVIILFYSKKYALTIIYDETANTNNVIQSSVVTCVSIEIIVERNVDRLKQVFYKIL